VGVSKVGFLSDAPPSAINCYAEDQFDGTSLIALLPTSISDFSIHFDRFFDPMRIISLTLANARYKHLSTKI